VEFLCKNFKRPPEGPAGADPAARGDDRGFRIERPTRGDRPFALSVSASAEADIEFGAPDQVVETALERAFA